MTAVLGTLSVSLTLLRTSAPMPFGRCSVVLARPDADALIARRRPDDAAKVPGARAHGIAHWTLALFAVAATAAARRGDS